MNEEIPKQTFLIKTKTIRLDQFLKYSGDAVSGAQAKQLIKNQKILVNGAYCSMRGKKIKKGDIIEIKDSHKYVIDYDIKLEKEISQINEE